MNPQQLSETFLNEYYQTLATNKAGLVNFYTEQSFMTYEGDSFTGLQQIMGKLQSLGFQTVIFTPYPNPQYLPYNRCSLNSKAWISSRVQWPTAF